MNSLRDLAVLIFGLSTRESNEFKQYADRQSGDHQYVRVYKSLKRILDSIKSVSDIPEESILFRRVRLEVKTGNISAYSTYLFKSILKCLSSTPGTQNHEENIQQAIRSSKLLARRGLFESAIALLEEASAEALNYEYYLLAIQAQKELVYLEGQRDSKWYGNLIKERLKKIELLSGWVNQENLYFTLHHRAFLLTRNKRLISDTPDLEELEALKKHVSLTHISHAPTFFSQVYFWQAKASVANMEVKLEEAYAASKQIVSLWQSEKYAHLQEEYPRLYIIHLHNLVSFAITNRDFDAAELLLKIMADFPCTDFDDEAEKFQNLLFSRQLLLLNTNRTMEAIEEVARQLGLIEGIYRSKINTARLISLYFNTLSACFLLHQFGNAQIWSDRIYQIGKTEQRRDIQFMNKVFQIIIRFELNNFHLLDREIKNTAQNLRDNGQYDEWSATILNFLGKLVKSKTSHKTVKANQEKDLFIKFSHALDQHVEKLNSRPVLGLNEIMVWVMYRCGQSGHKND